MQCQHILGAMRNYFLPPPNIQIQKTGAEDIFFFEASAHFWSEALE
jgi:hypothetical protein